VGPLLKPSEDKQSDKKKKLFILIAFLGFGIERLINEYQGQSQTTSNLEG
jgi:hypothetical protein